MASPSRISVPPGGNIVLSNPSTTSHNESTPNRRQVLILIYVVFLYHPN